AGGISAQRLCRRCDWTVLGPGESSVRMNLWIAKACCLRRRSARPCARRRLMKARLSAFGRFPLVAAAVAVAGVLSLAPARAAEPAERGVGSRPKAASGNATISACLEKLALSPQQQTQIQEIVRGYDADLTEVWKEFGERYLQTV